MIRKPRIAIIGAGLAGLSCAYYLEKKGYSPIIYEKDQKVGGRARTDLVNGFLLDRGFQVLLSNYPEFSRLFSKKELKLKTIPSATIVRYNQKWFTLENPLRNPSFLFKQACPFYSFNDLFSSVKLYLAEYTSSPHQLHVPTIEFLKDKGTSEELIKAFLRPFFGGIFLDKELKTRAQSFLTMSKLFTTGSACLPANGIQALASSLQNKLKTTQILYNHTVQNIDGKTLILNSGTTEADFVVLATDCVKATELVPSIPLVKTQSVTCLYFSIPSNLISVQPLIYLNGTQQGPINHLLFPNVIQPSYAPLNQVLASISVIDSDWQSQPNLVEAVKAQLAEWFKVKEQNWNLIHSYSIPHALPDQSSPPLFDGHYQCPHYPHLYLCGELVDEPSINGNLYSGRKMAEYLHQNI